MKRIQLRNSSDYDGVLSSLSRADAIAITSRVALRAFPILCSGGRRPSSPDRFDVLLNRVRLLMFCLTIGREGRRDKHLLNYAGPSISTAARLFDGSYDKNALNVLYSVYSMITSQEKKFIQSYHCRNANESLIRSIRGLMSPSTSHGDKIAIRRLVLDAMVRDISYLENSNADELFNFPLWGEKHPPDIITREWSNFKLALGNEQGKDDWVLIWTGWYEAWRDGRPPWGLPRNISDEIVRDSLLWPQEEWNRGSTHITRRFAELIEGQLGQASPNVIEQSSQGPRFRADSDVFSLERKPFSDDIEAAQDERVRKRHGSVIEKARELEILKRVDNWVGWQGIGDAASRLTILLDRPTDDLISEVAVIYDLTISLASYFEQDIAIMKDDDGFIEALPHDCRRILRDFIRTAAPWLRSFPSVVRDDDAAGAFLSRPELFAPVPIILNAARDTKLLAPDAESLLNELVTAAQRGDFQRVKAESRAYWGVRNVAVLAASLLSFHIGMVGNEAAPKSILAQKGADFYLEAENAILDLIANGPIDLRIAIAEIVKSIKGGRGDVPILPAAPRLPDRRIFRDDEEE